MASFRHATVLTPDKVEYRCTGRGCAWRGDLAGATRHAARMQYRVKEDGEVIDRRDTRWLPRVA